MARLDYWAIREAIKTALTNDPDLQDATVRIEEEFVFSTELVPYVGIYLDRRDSSSESQRIAAGTRVDYLIHFTIWCVHFSLDNIQKATQWRDDLVGHVEIALMRDRTLGGLVNYSWLTGGEMLSARNGNSGFLSIAETNLVAKVMATTNRSS